MSLQKISQARLESILDICVSFIYMNNLMEKVRSHRDDSILMVAMSIEPDNKGFLSFNIFLFCNVSIYVDIPYFVFITRNIYK